MPTHPTDAELEHTAGLIDKLGDQLNTTDNAGTAESIQQITQLVTSFIDRAAQGARQTLKRVLVVLVIGAAAAACTAYYLVNIVGLHQAWGALPIIAALVPGTVLLIGLRMLMAVVSLPGNLADVGDLLASIAKDHLHELHLLTEKHWSGLLKWRGYLLLAKLLWKLRGLTQQKTNEISGGILLFGLVANPIFWAILLGAILTLLFESTVMLAAVAIHALWL